MKQLCVLLVIFLSVNAFAQLQPVPKFSSINQFGFLKGSSAQTYQFQTINGIKYKTWFAGLGIGMEDYYRKSIPLFIDVRKSLINKLQSPFFYIDLGTALPIKKEEKTSWETKEFKKGLYFETGLGYSVPVRTKLYFNFSVGYSQKRSAEIITSDNIIWDFPPYNRTSEINELNYTFHRISVKAALQF